MEEKTVAEGRTDSFDTEAGKDEFDEMVEEIEIEDLAVDGICGVY